MKVLFQSRTTLFSSPGGDTVQLLKTKEYLEKLGLTIDVSTELEPPLAGYDMVHLFNLIRPQEVLTQARNAKKQKKPIALSTIYGLYTEYDKKARHGLEKGISRLLSTGQIEYLKTCARGIKNKEFHVGTRNYLLRGHLASQREIVSLVDVFLPNSESEMKRVWEDFPESRNKPYTVVPNAVDTEVFNPATVITDPSIEKYRDCILCVARIEGRKSQLNLVRAMKNLPWQLVLIGKAAPNHIEYYNQIVREAGDNIHILGHVEHNLLPAFYKVAHVHCLISWMETPGLSSLEAGIMGCNLVITDKGDTRDYFGNYALYCDPDSVDSIKDAIINAYNSPVNPNLQQHILHKYTWDKTALKTLEGYKYVI